MPKYRLAHRYCKYSNLGRQPYPDDFKRFALPHLKQIASEDYGVPLIMFAKGAEWAYPLFEDTNVHAFGIGWGCTPEDARVYADQKQFKEI